MRLTFLFLFLLSNSCVYSQNPSAYENLKKRMAIRQIDFAETYKKSSENDRSAIIQTAQNYLISTISDSLFTHWYGTPWNFNGTTKIPGKGSIACGYFVTTVLSDAGFKIPRVAWAQSASEAVILKIATNIQRYRKRPLNELIDYLNKNGDGLYIVGLDCHVGFIRKSGKNMQFIHSNYYRPEIGVMAEPLQGRNPLNDSKYRVVGKLIDNEMTKNWITGSAYK